MPEETQIKMLKFGAKWCPGCRQLDARKLLEKFHKAHFSELTMEQVDVDKESDRADKYSVEGIPVVIFEDNDGLELARVELGNVDPEDDLAELEETFEKAQKKFKRVQNKRTKPGKAASAED